MGDDVILVDNSPLAAGLTPESAIICSSWFGDDHKDTELMELLDVLEHCASCRSMPNFLDRRYGFASFLEHQRTMAQGVPLPAASPQVPGILGAPQGPVANMQQQ